MRLIRLVHAWAGATLSLLLIVLGLSGSLLVWKDDYLRATIPEARQTGSLDLDTFALVAQQAQDRLFAGPPSSITFATNQLGLHTVNLPNEAGAYLSRDGGIRLSWSGAERFEILLFDIHHYLLAGETGKIVAGASGLAALGLTLTGLVIALPALRLFSGRVWPSSGKRRELIIAHRDLGLIIAAPLMLATVTGAMLVFDDFARPALQAFAPGATIPKPPKTGVGIIDWSRAMSEAQRQFPTATIRIAIWPSAPGKPAAIRLRQVGEWHTNGRTIVWIDPETSQAVGQVDALALGGGDRFWNAIWPIHAAKLGDSPITARTIDWVTSLTGLGLALLGFYGLWAFAFKAPARR
jgi:uncharacterized iron-regulated membrane protein